jgi:hypothetical protein
VVIPIPLAKRLHFAYLQRRASEDRGLGSSGARRGLGRATPTLPSLGVESWVLTESVSKRYTKAVDRPPRRLSVTARRAERRGAGVLFPRRGRPHHHETPANAGVSLFLPLLPPATPRTKPASCNAPTHPMVLVEPGAPGRPANRRSTNRSATIVPPSRNMSCKHEHSPLLRWGSLEHPTNPPDGPGGRVPPVGWLYRSVVSVVTPPQDTNHKAAAAPVWTRRLPDRFLSLCGSPCDDASRCG